MKKIGKFFLNFMWIFIPFLLFLFLLFLRKKFGFLVIIILFICSIPFIVKFNVCSYRKHLEKALLFGCWKDAILLKKTFHFDEWWNPYYAFDIEIQEPKKYRLSRMSKGSEFGTFFENHKEGSSIRVFVWKDWFWFEFEIKEYEKWKKLANK